MILVRIHLLQHLQLLPLFLDHVQQIRNTIKLHKLILQSLQVVRALVQKAIHSDREFRTLPHVDLFEDTHRFRELFTQREESCPLRVHQHHPTHKFVVEFVSVLCDGRMLVLQSLIALGEFAFVVTVREFLDVPDLSSPVFHERVEDFFDFVYIPTDYVVPGEKFETFRVGVVPFVSEYLE